MGFFRVYALSSYTEGLPVVILEAMAEGLPVVATEVGSIPQVLDGGRCGRLVGPGDARTLGEALAATLGDAAYAERMRALAQSRFLRFHSSQAMADAYRQLYRALAGRRRVGAAAA
jgi:glycosyltransferase involved in cell wall biosynthesis